MNDANDDKKLRDYKKRATEARLLAAHEETAAMRRILLRLAALWESLARINRRHSWAGSGLAPSIWCAVGMSICCMPSLVQCFCCLST
jgi:hypothetical protein